MHTKITKIGAGALQSNRVANFAYSIITKTIWNNLKVAETGKIQKLPKLANPESSKSYQN